MKKILFYISAIAGLFYITACEKEINSHEPEVNSIIKSVPFELIAKTPETRTTLDASWKLDWEIGDILYAVTTDEEWGKPYSSAEPNIESIAEFTYSNGKFSTEKTISDGEHTFNFIYTRGDQKTFHRGLSTTNALPTEQTVDANNPTARLKNYDAMAAQVKATTPTDFVGISMSHLYALMKVTLKNTTSNAITVTKFQITASNATLAGIFTVLFGDTPSIETKTDYGSSLTVIIENGTIAANDELPVYFVMPPLNNYSGDITFKVTDSEDNVYSKTNTVSNISFDAGTYNTANFSIKSSQVKKTVTFNVGTEIISVFSATKDGIRFTYDQGESSTAPSYYSPFRWYKNSTVKIDGGTAKITGVDFTFSGNNYLGDISPNLGEYSVSGTSGTWSGNVNSVIFTNGGTAARFSSIIVTYSGNGSLTVESFDPTIEFESENISVVAGNTVPNSVNTNSPSPVEYFSNNTSVATVDSEGNVTGVSAGTAIITASVAAKNTDYTKVAAASTTCSVTVTSQSTSVLLELDMTTKSVGQSAYNATTEYGSWKIVNGANNNKNWAYFKMGGKEVTLEEYNPCYIYSTKAIDAEAKSVAVHLPSGSLSKNGMSVNSWGVYVYSDSAMTAQIDYVAGGTITNEEGTFTFTPSTGKTWAKGSYFKVSWDLVNSTTTNGIVCVDKITVSNK